MNPLKRSNSDDRDFKPHEIAYILYKLNMAFYDVVGFRLHADINLDDIEEGVKHYQKLLESNEDTSERKTHEIWLEGKLQAGWKYGEILNNKRKENPWIIPYDYLSLEQRCRLYLFSAIIKAFYCAMQEDKLINSKNNNTTSSAVQTINDVII